MDTLIWKIFALKLSSTEIHEKYSRSKFIYLIYIVKSKGSKSVLILSTRDVSSSFLRQHSFHSTLSGRLRMGPEHSTSLPKLIGKFPLMVVYKTEPSGNSTTKYGVFGGRMSSKRSKDSASVKLKPLASASS